MSNYNTQSLRNMTEDGVSWCCDLLVRSSGLTKVTVRAGEEESRNLWLFTLEYRTANHRYARSYAALRTQWESQKDFDLLYKELQVVAREIIEAAEGAEGRK